VARITPPGHLFSKKQKDLNAVIKTYLLFPALLLFLSINVRASDSETTRTGNECINALSIKGSSNINQFRLVHDNPLITSSSGISSNRAHDILIPVYDFTGPNHRMLNDFYNMVKASRYPFIRISLEPDDTLLVNRLPEKVKFKSEISIAGITNHYFISCEISSCKDSDLVIKGNLKMELTDFNITPPEKVFGAVKVNNEVFITFAFKINAEEILTEKITQ
jgi:hypothetical protein